MTKLAYLYDHALAEKLRQERYDHIARGVYAYSENSIVWHGLSVSFHQRAPTLVVQPNLSIFCPGAFKLVEEYLGRESFGSHGSMRKLGYPFISYPLYDRAHVLCGADRLASSYNVVTADQIENGATLICEDYSKVANEVFKGTSTMEELRDRILVRPQGTGAGLYVIALSYLVDEKITATEIDRFADICPSPMTTEFAKHMKEKIDARSH